MSLLAFILLLFFLLLWLSPIVKRLKIPPLVIYLSFGILAGASVLAIIPTTFKGLFVDVKTFALIVILLRAGLGLNLKNLKKYPLLGPGLSLLPGLAEGLILMLLARHFWDFSWREAGMLGFILAAVSPAVIIPAMLEFKEKYQTQSSSTIDLVLFSVSVDDVVAITLFSFFAYTSFEAPDLRLSGLFFYKVLTGLAIGVMTGYLLRQLLRVIHWPKDLEILFLLLAAWSLIALGEHFAFAGLLSVLIFPFPIQSHQTQLMPEERKRKMQKLWLFAEILLFFVIGSELQLNILKEDFFIIAGFVFAGLLVRSAMALLLSLLFRQTWRQALFIVLASLPKATVQAALGSIPLSLGFSKGPFILAVAVGAIVLTAPLGSLLIYQFGPVLLKDKTA